MGVLGQALTQGARRDGLAAVRVQHGAVGRDEEELGVADVALLEPGLAVGEVEVPQADEALVEPERGELGAGRVEVGPPAAQRLGVVQADVVVPGEA